MSFRHTLNTWKCKQVAKIIEHSEKICKYLNIWPCSVSETSSLPAAHCGRLSLQWACFGLCCTGCQLVLALLYVESLSQKRTESIVFCSAVFFCVCNMWMHAFGIYSGSSYHVIDSTNEFCGQFPSKWQEGISEIFTFQRCWMELMEPDLIERW